MSKEQQKDLNCAGEKLNSVEYEDDRFRHVSFFQTTFDGCTYFKKTQFLGHADFNESKFLEYSDFRQTIFTGPADFGKAKFESYIDFNGAMFKHTTRFSNVTFCDVANFNCTSFQTSVSFEKTIFRDATDFSHSSFNNIANFKKAYFHFDSKYNDSTFQEVDFREAIFNDKVVFKNVNIDKANFCGAIFKNKIDFTEAAFNGPVLFDNTTQFHHVPIFSGIKGNGVFDVAKADFSQALKNSKKNKTYATDALYFCQLRREMEERKQHDAALTFFAYELRCRAEASDSAMYRAMISIYETTSDFGREIALPAKWLLRLFLLGTLVYYFIAVIYGFTSGEIKWIDLFHIIPHSLNHSAYYSIPLLYSESTMHIENSWAILAVNCIQLAQRLISFGLIFLIGLGIRNKLRIG